MVFSVLLRIVYVLILPGISISHWVFHPVAFYFGCYNSHEIPDFLPRVGPWVLIKELECSRQEIEMVKVTHG